MPSSPVAEGVLDAALAQSRALAPAHHRHIASGHVLLALLAPGTRSAGLVEAIGHDSDRLRGETARRLLSDARG